MVEGERLTSLSVLLNRDFKDLFQDKLGFHVLKRGEKVFITLMKFGHPERIWTTELLKYLERTYGLHMLQIEAAEETATLATFKYDENQHERLKTNLGGLQGDRHAVLQRIYILS
jgi:hypothetical protein